MFESDETQGLFGFSEKNESIESEEVDLFAAKIDNETTNSRDLARKKLFENYDEKIGETNNQS